jgi:anthranilate 1,2-dioxygenase small subunit
MISSDTRAGIADLILRNAHFIDTDHLEEWAGCFAEDGRYVVTTRENVDLGFEGVLMSCEGMPMLRDRVQYIRKAAVFNIHRDRHIVGQPLISEEGDGRYKALTSFALYQSEPDRDSRLFCLGCYEDVISLVEGAFRFRSRRVVLDNDTVTPLLSNPV